LLDVIQAAKAALSCHRPRSGRSTIRNAQRRRRPI